MANILLTHCNHLYYDRKQVRKMQPYPPLQTIIAAAHLREAGFEVALFDATLNSPEQGFKEALLRYKPGLVVVCEDHFNFLTKMCLRRNRELAFVLARIAGEYDTPMAVTSSDAADHPHTYLSQGIRIVIVGEIEHTLVDLAHHYMNSRPRKLAQVAGLAYLDEAEGDLRYTTARQLERDLSRFPLPAWDLLDMDSYREKWLGAHGFFGLNLIAGRGCSYHCNWCAKPVFGQSYRVSPATRVAVEMRFLKEKFHPDQIWFADDVFALSPQWTHEFANTMEISDARIPFKTQSRCDLMTKEITADLQRADCIEVWLGAESGSQKILDSMDKGINVDDVYTANRNLKDHGIRTCLFLQFGYPGETWADIQSSIRMVREIAPADVGVSVYYPLPGTRQYMTGDGRANDNWIESGDLAVASHAIYSSEFYAALHDALHLEVDLSNGRPDVHQNLGELWRQVRELCTMSGILVEG